MCSLFAYEYVRFLFILQAQNLLITVLVGIGGARDAHSDQASLWFAHNERIGSATRASSFVTLFLFT